MNPTFKAAASYFGLPADQVIDGEIADVWGEDITVLTVKIKLSAKDIQGIKDRHQGMETIAKYRQPKQPESEATILFNMLTDMRKELGQIGAASKQMAEQFDRVSSGGTVIMVDIDGDIKTAQKMSDASHGILSQPTPVADVKREVKHVDVPDHDGSNEQKVVWLPPHRVTDGQIGFIVDERMSEGLKEYAVNVQMLTPEQRKEAGLP